VDRFVTNLERLLDDVFDWLEVLHRSAYVEAIQHRNAASWSYDSTAEENYYRFGCMFLSMGAKIPITAEFTQAKRTSQEGGEVRHA